MIEKNSFSKRRFLFPLWMSRKSEEYYCDWVKEKSWPVVFSWRLSLHSIHVQTAVKRSHCIPILFKFSFVRLFFFTSNEETYLSVSTREIFWINLPNRKTHDYLRYNEPNCPSLDLKNVGYSSPSFESNFVDECIWSFLNVSVRKWSLENQQD